MDQPQIPLIDIGAVLSPKNNKNDWLDASEALDHALRTTGFMYLKNHGISNIVIDDAFTSSKAFFQLDAYTKQKYQMDAKKEYFGYVQPNQQQLDSNGAYECRESFDFLLNLKQKLRDGNSDVANFYISLEKLANDCVPLIKTLFKILTKSLELTDQEAILKTTTCISDHTVPSMSAFRTLYYPSVQNIQHGTIRLAPHSDYGTITLLFQDHIGGLEIQTRNKKWIPVKPVRDTILVNTGNLLYLMSGGRYMATVHRVLMKVPEGEILPPRQSMAFFVIPDNDAIVTPLIDSSNFLLNTQKMTALEHVKRLVDKSYKY